MSDSYAAAIAALSDKKAIQALQDSSRRYLELSGVAVAQITAVTREIALLDAPATLSALESASEEECGELARTALLAMFNSSDRRAARLVELAVRDLTVEGQAEPITLIIGGTFLLALALASKVSYSKKDGFGLKPGFPGLAKVLEKGAKLVSAAMGAGDEGNN